MEMFKKAKEWICNGNDCSKCKYCWEVKTSYEYDEWDCGCYIKGEDFEDKPCYLIKPLKIVLGELSKRKVNYYMDHQYDGFVEFMEDLERKEDKLHELFMSKVIKDCVICWKSQDGTLHECNTDSLVRHNIWEVRSEYEDFAHPIIYKNLSTEWKELIVKTIKRLYKKTLFRIVPYLHK